MFRKILLSLKKSIMKNQNIKSEDSIFENIPEATQPLSFADGTVDKPTQKLIAKRSSIYLIMNGNDNTEYYTSTTPEIYEDKMVLYNPVKKGVIREPVLDDFVEEYFCDRCETSMSFLISEGIMMKRHFEDELPWLNRDISDAQVVIKDKVIMKYNQIVPTLMNNIKVLQTKTQQMQQAQQHTQEQRQQKRQQKQHDYDDDLLDI